jgi:hypothetical protein
MFRSRNVTKPKVTTNNNPNNVNAAAKKPIITNGYSGYKVTNLSNKATFIDPLKVQLNQTTTNVNGNKITKGHQSKFTLGFHDSDGVRVVFVFSLMPAMENMLRGNNNGLAVPEVKPGISFRTDINTKKMNIPGGPPVFQSLGIDKTILQITACLIGNETAPYVDSKTKQNTTNLNKNTNVGGNELITSTGAYGAPVLTSFNAMRSAIFLDTQVVQLGRPVIFSIYSDSHSVDTALDLNVRCLIQSLRILGRYSDRCYLSFDLVLLDYMNQSSLTDRFKGGFSK